MNVIYKYKNTKKKLLKNPKQIRYHKNTHTYQDSDNRFRKTQIINNTFCCN